MSAILDARCSKCGTNYRFDPDKPYPPTPTCHSCLYATIAAQAERVRALEAALKPFVAIGQMYLPVDATDKSVYLSVSNSEHLPGHPSAPTIGDWRNAAKIYKSASAASAPTPETPTLSEYATAQVAKERR